MYEIFCEDDCKPGTGILVPCTVHAVIADLSLSLCLGLYIANWTRTNRSKSETLANVEYRNITCHQIHIRGI